MTQSDAQKNLSTNQKINKIENEYQRGNFKDARPCAESLLESDDLKEKETTRLQQILTAIAADPLATVAYGVTLFLLLFLSMKYLL